MKLRMWVAVLAAWVSFADTAAAADIASHRVLTADGAKALATIAIAYAQAHTAPGAAVAVVDAGGVALYLERLDGTFANASNISIGKARTAALFGKPTRVFEDAVNKGRYTMLALPDVAPFTPLMGGVPIDLGGEIVGAIGVSGAASAAQDDEIASAAAAQFVQRQTAQASRVTHVPAAQVADAFPHDATLVSSDAYRVNASHRDGPGQAEVHLDDTDIFYVIEGNAQLVTGGEVVAPRHVASREIRGSAIEGGDEIALAPGDVVTIPRGVPHWFKGVQTPFQYYVVKTTNP